MPFEKCLDVFLSLMQVSPPNRHTAGIGKEYFLYSRLISVLRNTAVLPTYRGLSLASDVRTQWRQIPIKRHRSRKYTPQE